MLAVLVLLVATGAIRVVPPPTLEIEAVVVEAEPPAGGDVIRVRGGERRLWLEVTSARLATTGGFVRMREGLLDYRLIGRRELVARVMEAASGTRVHGRFTYYATGKRLLIVELLAP